MVADGEFATESVGTGGSCDVSHPQQRAAGYQVPLDIGQFMTTGPAKDTTRKTCYALWRIHTVHGQEDAQPIQQIARISASGPIMSVRAFEFESLYGWGLLLPSTGSKNNCVGHRSLRHAATLQAQRFLLVRQTTQLVR